MSGEDDEFHRRWRDPVTRADCANIHRPCPYAGCRHNLLVDITYETRGNRSLNDRQAVPDGVKFASAAREPDELPANRSCSLDVAEEGGMTLAEVAESFGCVRENIRLIEVKALTKLRDGLRFINADGFEPTRETETPSESEFSEGEGGGRTCDHRNTPAEEVSAAFRRTIRRAYARRMVDRGLVGRPDTRACLTPQQRGIIGSEEAKGWTDTDQAEVDAWADSIVLVDGKMRDAAE
jgi:hypothetical protein